ncbi:leucine-rich repeat-containing serine/threonine-protein kinase [Pseudomonas sp. MAFF 302046]|uniref:Leucine-rich repeat-containing serine/threonine-protein kinase n=1 Tax=Pseudomonas morbosilactucae TaxID=2938197 RepID=A0ABT0JI88_9PSED|nr:leucine-rich repeat-containing protein kinase family protein [Pseudomonas morbosilactucae]MCK9815599.1 leucine-rich repeat-containing serine/threonine-protein kinase [Pseudomonas morbosilactucae]
MTDTLAQLRAGQLTGLKRLDLSCGLTQFPREIFDLADSLEVLNLSGNALSSLPDDLHRLPHLRILFCSDNRFTELPACLGQCAQLSMIGFKANQIERVPAEALPPLLRWLILTDNRLSELPEELGRRPLLQKLMLSGNRLSALPQSLSQCHRLELLRIAANQLRALPPFLLALPRLTWLAYAGNPLESEAGTEALASTACIAWSELTLQQRLGEGASGVIYQAQWQPAQQPARPVAVKLYKGEMTSDGSPLHEMNACVSAGLHPNLIRVEGRIADHPDGQNGLVMQLIDPSYRNLAGLPSLDSCSRDIYPADARYNAEVILRMASGVASVGAHLHAQGITHGDLYGHNLLWNEQGDCLLGDFGAAAFHAQNDSVHTRALQRLEVRAFGILLEELLERGDGSLAEEQRKKLQTLVEQCCQPEVLARPDFVQVARGLAAL